MADSFPPRGFGAEQSESAPDRRWGNPEKLGPGWSYSGRKILLGRCGDRLIGDPDQRNVSPGHGDDRHIVTIAGSRAGKSRTVLTPNLMRYPGSAVVIDPKGELARDTAETRSKFGDVYILDPFRIAPRRVERFQASFNPIHSLQQSRAEEITADAAMISDALIIPGGGDAHWTDSAKNLIRGLCLHMLDGDPLTATLRQLRRTLSGTTDDLNRAFEAMARSQAHDGIVANTGRGFKSKVTGSDFSPELRSIISTANEQTWPLDDVAHISEESSFHLHELTARPMTIYLVLPATRLVTHSRWLRMFVNLAIAAIERNPVRKLYEGGLPVWLVLEEFAALGSMKSIETAAGFMAGMGCKLWVVLQDLTQLKTHYANSWETFLGNAGIIQAWSNVDATTTEYLSKLIGQTTITESRYDQISTQNMERGDSGRREQLRTVPLLDPTEVTYHFARETGRQLILSSGRPPIFLERLL